MPQVCLWTQTFFGSTWHSFSWLATSTAVERVFSQGQQILHFTQNSLNPESLHAFLCLGSWSQHNMVVMDDILDVVKSNLTKRKRAEAEAGKVDAEEGEIKDTK